MLAHGARCGWEGHKEAVILPILSVQQQQQPVIHEPYHVQTLPGELRLWAVPKRGVHHGSAVEKPSEDSTGCLKTGTPSSSEKEPMPRVPRRAPRVSPCHSQHSKKKKSDSAKKSSGEGSSPRCTRSPNATRRRCLRRRSITSGTKQTRASLTSPARSEPHRCCASYVHPSTLCVPRVAHLLSQKCCPSCSFNHHFTYVLHNLLYIKFFLIPDIPLLLYFFL